MESENDTRPNREVMRIPHDDYMNERGRTRNKRSGWQEDNQNLGPDSGSGETAWNRLSIPDVYPSAQIMADSRRFGISIQGEKPECGSKPHVIQMEAHPITAMKKLSQHRRLLRDGMNAA